MTEALLRFLICGCAVDSTSLMNVCLAYVMSWTPETCTMNDHISSAELTAWAPSKQWQLARLKYSCWYVCSFWICYLNIFVHNICTWWPSGYLAWKRPWNTLEREYSRFESCFKWVTDEKRRRLPQWPICGRPSLSRTNAVIKTNARLQSASRMLHHALKGAASWLQRNNTCTEEERSRKVESSWCLFSDAAFALLGRRGGCDFGCLHELADVSDGYVS